MSRVVFECESVTPIFMYGADGTTPELRPASIKGLMRFWWRAINGDLPLDDLKKQEDEIFGNTEKKSSFSINLSNIALKKELKNPIPHKKKGDKGYHQKNAFIENQTFQVIFRGKNLELISNIFKLSTLLGGFGQRSRRGFGSIRIKGDDTLVSIEEIEKLIKSINLKFEYNHRNKSKNEQYPYIKKFN
jgi:CRISPR-associated protein Cmr1